MKNKIRQWIYHLCRIGITLGFTVYFSGTSLLFFGEPEPPIE